MRLFSLCNNFIDEFEVEICGISILTVEEIQLQGFSRNRLQITTFLLRV